MILFLLGIWGIFLNRKNILIMSMRAPRRVECARTKRTMNMFIM
jgi:hypothetical protein